MLCQPNLCESLMNLRTDKIFFLFDSKSQYGLPPVSNCKFITILWFKFRKSLSLFAYYKDCIRRRNVQRFHFGPATARRIEFWIILTFHRSAFKLLYLCLIHVKITLYFRFQPLNNLFSLSVCLSFFLILDLNDLSVRSVRICVLSSFHNFSVDGIYNVS